MMTDLERTKSILKELDVAFISYGNLHDDEEHGCKVIEKALKKTIPMKPVWTIPTRKNSGKTWCCPVCGYTAIRSYKYCQHDGTRFDWSDIE